MKFATIKSLALSLSLFLGASIAGAATVTVGPTGTYATPCAAFPHLADGDTVLVDANGGVPYTDEHDCIIKNNNLTIAGVNGRPIIDSGGTYVYYALWRVDGHDVVIDNFEFRNGQGGTQGNAEAIRIEAGDGTPAGGNVTVQHSYIHDCGTGILSDAINPGGVYAYYSPKPFITFQYDEFYHNGAGGGQTHNIYIGYGGNLTFNMYYSWSHDLANSQGHLLKDRAPYSNVYYNLFSDQLGSADYLLDFGDGGSVYAVANSIYKAAACAECNQNFMIYRNAQDTDGQAEYTNEDFHFINNTLVDDPANTGSSQVISMECFGQANSDNCPLPKNGGPGLTTAAVLENNIVLGPPGLALTNQSEAYTSNNISLTNTPSNLASMDFNNPAALDYRLTPGSPAIGTGIYPPTDNTGTADPAALAQDEYSIPMNGVAWPTPSGSTMDAGAFYYAGAITPPSITLNYTTSVTVPDTGTITVSGLPTPPAGQFNYAAFVSQNTAVIPTPLSVASSTSTITATFTTIPEMTTTVVPISIYVGGTVLTANITVNPGPPTLNSIALNNGRFYPSTTVTLEGPAPAGGTVVSLTSSDPTIWYAPASVTVPAGQLSVSGGTFGGSLWAPPLSAKGPVTLTATAGSAQATLTAPVYSPVTHAFECNNYTSSCSVTGGQPYNVILQMAGISPVGGSTVTFTSNNTAVIPNQSYVWPQGASGNFSDPADYVPLNTNSVATATNVVITATFDGQTYYQPITLTVNPPTTTITAVSGSGQTAAVGTNFPNPLVVLVKDPSGNPLPGASVTFTGTNVSFPSGATVVTDNNGDAQVLAQPTAVGPITITATAAGVTPSVSFSETATQVPASIAAVSGSGQRASAGTSFANPLVVIVKDAGGNPATGLTVTFAGANVSFPAGATATTNSSGQASITAQPTATGNLTVTASVAGVSTPASFSEKGAPAVTLASITLDGSGPGTIVNLSTQSTSPVVVQLVSSDPTVLFTPPTVTVPAGATSAAIGSLIGSFWTPPNSAKTATLTATYQGSTVSLAVNFYSPSIYFFKCDPASCQNVVGGNPYGFTLQLTGTAPVGGGTVQITSDNPAVIPNQAVPIPAGGTFPSPYRVSFNTNAVTTITPVTVTATYNGSVVSAGPIKVTPPGVPASIVAVSGAGQTVAVNTVPFANPLVVLVEDSQGNPALPGTTVTFAGSGVSFPSGATATTDSLGHAQVTAQPTATGTLTVTASVSGVTVPASFSETGTPPPASVAVVSGSGQTTAAGTAFAGPLAVVVKDANGNPVASVPVTFAGTGVTFPSGATAVTNSSGLAQVTAQPGQNSLGSLTILATVPGLGTSATFSETSTPGAPASVVAVSGSGQTAVAGNSFADPLVVVVKDTYGNLVAGATVTFAGTGVVFPSGAAAVTNSSGQAQVIAQPGPTSVGALTITAMVAGVGTPASFSEVGAAGPPASVVGVSGDGQTSALEINFTSPLVTVVRDANGNPVAGATVTFAGNNISFPSGATVVTGSNGLAQITAQPTTTGALTVTATVPGVTGIASFSETGISGGDLTAVTLDGRYYPHTTVSLAAAATAPVVVHLSSSDPSILWAPATVTIPTGKTSAETGTLDGSLWAPPLSAKGPVTLTATYNGVTQTLTTSIYSPAIHGIGCGSGCSVVGGQSYNVLFQMAGYSPEGGSTLYLTSNNPDVIPNQSFFIPAGAQNPVGGVKVITNAVATSTVVTLTATYDGVAYYQPLVFTVNP